MPSRTRLRAHGLAQHDAERRCATSACAMRSSSSERSSRVHVAALVDQAAAPHLADFVDAVGELVAAVLDMDAGVRERQIAAVDIGDAGHRCLTARLRASTRFPAP